MSGFGRREFFAVEHRADEVGRHLVGVRAEVNPVSDVGYRSFVKLDWSSITRSTIQIEGNAVGVRSKKTPAYKNTAIGLPHGNNATREVLHLALGKQG